MHCFGFLQKLAAHNLDGMVLMFCFRFQALLAEMSYKRWMRKIVSVFMCNYANAKFHVEHVFDQKRQSAYDQSADPMA